MTSAQRTQLLEILRDRFMAHPQRHAGIAWGDIAVRLESHPAALETLLGMERSGGEPDVIGRDLASGAITFCDCSAESPSGRRSLCFDRSALDSRKENKPAGSAMELAATIGIQLLSEAEYRALQTLGAFDRKTSSWVRTPPAIRALGGALFCDRRYDTVFVYHNGAESYYAARGFRGILRV
ncbi:MAG: DUF4256 domain-containing protein [Gemmatimonadaceae bacterium]|nr:DUF4256 domain-containing protein [Gemmatimonadaceae bacterium]